MATTQTEKKSSKTNGQSKAKGKKAGPIGGILPQGGPTGAFNQVQGLPKDLAKPEKKGKAMDRGAIFRITANSIGHEFLKTIQLQSWDEDKQELVDRDAGEIVAELKIMMLSVQAKAQELTARMLEEQADETDGQHAQASRFLVEWGQRFGVEPQLAKVDPGDQNPIRFEPFGMTLNRFVDAWDPKANPALGQELVNAAAKVKFFDRDGNGRPAIFGKPLDKLQQRVSDRMVQALQS